MHLGLLALATAVVCSALGMRGAAAGTTLTMTSATVALLSPLFWRATDRIGEVMGWCAGCVVLALGLACTAAPSAGQLCRTAIILFALLSIVHAPLWYFNRQHEAARAVLATALTALGALPLWLGPVAAARGGESAVGGLALLCSPLVHLAAAADSDLLRIPWFYSHTVLGSMRFEYPDSVATAICDGTLGLVTWIAVSWAARVFKPQALIQTPQECHR